MRKLIDANRTQAVLDWRQLDWRRIEKTVLRLQHRIFMAKVKGDVQGMESLQRLLTSSRAAKLLAIRKVGVGARSRRPTLVDTVNSCLGSPASVRPSHVSAWPYP
jgi:RNA-directed DNA polymerase